MYSFFMNNNDSPIFTRDIQHFLTIRLFFEKLLLNLTEGGKHSRELTATTRVMPAVRQYSKGKVAWPRNSKATPRRYRLERAEGEKYFLVRRRTEKSRKLV